MTYFLCSDLELTILCQIHVKNASHLLLQHSTHFSSFKGSECTRTHPAPGVINKLTKLNKPSYSLNAKKALLHTQYLLVGYIWVTFIVVLALHICATYLLKCD